MKTPGRRTRRSTRGTSFQVLVVYGRRFGSTGEVAERIVTRMRVGTPVFNRRWMPEGDEFAQRNGAARPAWLFSVGTFGDRERVIASVRHSVR